MGEVEVEEEAGSWAEEGCEGEEEQEEGALDAGASQLGGRCYL